MDTDIDQAQNLKMPEQVERALVERIDKDRIDLPVLPQVAGKVMALTNDPAADAARLSALIHQDQALAAHVLRIANSPAYMPRTPIASLQHAVAMLGVNELSEIAVTISLKSGTGILHAVGKPVVLKTVTTIAGEMHIPLDSSAIIAFLDGYHSRIGSLIATEWALPPQVTDAITYYGLYEQAPSHRQEAMMTCLADRLATYILVPDSFDDTTLREHGVFADLNLYPNNIDALLSLKEKVINLVDTMAQ